LRAKHGKAGEGRAKQRKARISKAVQRQGEEWKEKGKQ
jgi:hypothetical protein